MCAELTVPFVTVAQQAGAECSLLPQALAKALSQRDPGGPKWSVWDRNLIEKVSLDHHIPADLIGSIETSGYSWIGDLLAGVTQQPDDIAIFRRVKQAVINLARGGRVILVGHGSVYMTRDLASGVHVRLIAPMKVRVNNVAIRFGLSRVVAARRIRRLDRQRQTFFRRFWPDLPLTDEMFTAVFNSARLDSENLVQAILQMIPVMPAVASSKSQLR
jgi:cytidylate kinase